MSNKPVIQLKNGRGLSISVFANATEEGKTYYNSPGVENRYKDKEGEWKSTHRISEADFLEASELLREAASRVRRRRLDKADAPGGDPQGDTDPAPASGVA